MGQKKEEEDKEVVRDYILMVVTKHGDEGFGYGWYGWSRNLYFTYDEAVEKKESIKDRYYDVDIMKVEK